MRKRDELSRPDSCMSKARDDEMTFVLLGRDEAAPRTIRFWIKERIRLGKNKDGDCQILEAEECARIMERERSPKVEITPENIRDIQEIVRNAAILGGYSIALKEEMPNANILIDAIHAIKKSSEEIKRRSSSKPDDNDQHSYCS